MCNKVKISYLIGDGQLIFNKTKLAEIQTKVFVMLNMVITHSWSRALLEKLPIVQLLENFPAFYGTRRFITAFT
jgi:hypothetical protein